MTTTLSFALHLEQATLEELEGAFPRWVGDDVVFLPGLDDPPVGSRVHVDVKLKGGDVALSLTGHVSWRYPADAVPPGREAGVGVLVEEASAEHRALLEKLRAHASAGQSAQAPGARLGPLSLREYRAPAVEERERAQSATDAEGRVQSSLLDDGFEIRTSDFVLAEHEGRLLERQRDNDDARLAARPLPAPPAAPPAPDALPSLTGMYFAYEYEDRRMRGVKFSEPFAWPKTGTLRPSRGDVRTRAPGDDAPGDLYDDYRSPWDDVTDDQRAPEEVSDPGRRVTDVVNSAVDDVADVEKALGDASPRPPPRRVHDDDEADVTETDGQPFATESSQAPETALPMGLRVRVDEGDAEELFAAGLGVPASRTFTVSRASGAESVKVSVLEGSDLGEGRHLGSFRVRPSKGSGSADVRFDMRADGVLEARSSSDASVRESWRTSWATPAEASGRRSGRKARGGRSRQRRGWLARLFGR